MLTLTSRNSFQALVRHLVAGSQAVFLLAKLEELLSISLVTATQGSRIKNGLFILMPFAPNFLTSLSLTPNFDLHKLLAITLG